MVRVGSGARAEVAPRGEMRRMLGPVQLTALGVATIIGSGIFVLVGEAAQDYAGPAVAVSFLLAGVVAGLSALCYAELASAIRVTGSTYTYVSAALGPLVGWLVGWSILLEYVLGGAAVAIGWSGYFTGVLESVGIDLPHTLVAGPFQDGGSSGVVNLPAVLLVVALVALLLRGVRESARAATVFTAIKLGALALFVVLGAFHLSSGNYEPFVPPAQGFGEFGAAGILRAAGVVFFAYIGFDVVCTAAQEARNPQRTVPVGLLGALGVATLAYAAVAIVLVGLADYRTLGVADPLAQALSEVQALGWLQRVVELAAVVGLAAGVLALLYGLSRIFMRMAEDRTIPMAVGRVSPRSGVPARATVIVGVVIVAAAALLPISTLAELISVGTLIAFLFVAVAVIALRRRHPELERPFRIPFGLAIPVTSIVLTLVVMATLPHESLLRAAGWLVVGLVVYVAYSRSRLIDQRHLVEPGAADRA